MAIFRPYQDFWDMPLNPKDGKHPGFSHAWGNVIWVLLGVSMKVAFRYHVDKREALRDFNGKGGVLLVAPHKSFFDVIFLYLAARPNQWVRFVARDNLFTAAHGLGGFIFSRIGAFPIKRDSADRTALKRAARMLKDGEVVGIFPEGTRRGKAREITEVHAGAAFIARMGNAPLLPVCVRNVEHIKQKNNALPRFPKVSVEFGEAVLLKDFAFLPKKEQLEACSWYVMREAFALDKRVKPEDIHMPDYFPATPDYADVFAEHPIPHYTAEQAIAELEK